LFRLTVNAGMLNPLIVIALAKSSWLTSGLTCRLTCFASMIVGVKSSLTPNCLYSIVIVAKPPVPGCEIGIGISPPTRKLAGCPDVAVKFGSASRSYS